MSTLNGEEEDYQNDAIKIGLHGTQILLLVSDTVEHFFLSVKIHQRARRQLDSWIRAFAKDECCLFVTTMLSVQETKQK